MILNGVNDETRIKVREAAGMGLQELHSYIFLFSTGSP